MNAHSSGTSRARNAIPSHPDPNKSRERIFGNKKNPVLYPQVERHNASGIICKVLELAELHFENIDLHPVRHGR